MANCRQIAMSAERVRLLLSSVERVSGDKTRFLGVGLPVLSHMRFFGVGRAVLYEAERRDESIYVYTYIKIEEKGKGREIYIGAVDNFVHRH